MYLYIFFLDILPYCRLDFRKEQLFLALNTDCGKIWLKSKLQEFINRKARRSLAGLNRFNSRAKDLICADSSLLMNLADKSIIADVFLKNVGVSCLHSRLEIPGASTEIFGDFVTLRSYAKQDDADVATTSWHSRAVRDPNWIIQGVLKKTSFRFTHYLPNSVKKVYYVTYRDYDDRKININNLSKRIIFCIVW